MKFEEPESYDSSITPRRPDVPVVTHHTHPPAVTRLRRDYAHAPERQYGRHGDINPGNILWYNNGADEPGVLKGTLKIADFGQAELNSLKSRTKPRDVANTLTYRPPECDTLAPSKKPLIRQTYDMWCLGCVFLEFVTWMLGGDELQERFTNLRDSEDFFQNHATTDTFFQVRRNSENRLEVTVKEAVTQVRIRLIFRPFCSLFTVHR